MSIIASLKPIIRLLLMASYAAYCVIGLACIVLGAYYAGAIDGAFTSVITVTILSGLLMLPRAIKPKENPGPALEITLSFG